MKRSLIFLTALVCGSLVSHANLVVNGSFENPVVTSETPGYPDPLVTSIPGWTTIFGNFNLCGIDSWQSADGNQNLELAGNTKGGLFQEITTEAGQEYTFSFYYSDNPYYAASHQGQGRVMVVDSATESSLINTVFTGPINNTPGNMNWQGFTMNFTAISSTTMLSFEDLTNSSAIDGVSIDAIPEPASALLIAVASACIVSWRRIFS